MKTLTLSYSPERLYRFDDVQLTVDSGGDPVSGASVYVNGEYWGVTNDGNHTLLSLEGGTYEVSVSRDGFTEASVTVVVNAATYATSQDVRMEMSPAERQRAFDEGRADVRFYETPFCTNCALVRGKLNKLVDSNRGCVVYEKLSYYKFRNELGTGERPFIVVEGSYGKYTVNGRVSMTKVKDLIERASGCDVS